MEPQASGMRFCWFFIKYRKTLQPP